MQKAIIDHADNPELNNYLLSLENGDEGEMRVKFRKVSTDGGQSEVSIEKVIIEYEDEETEIEPSEEEPIAIAIVETSDLEELSSEEGDEVIVEDELDIEPADGMGMMM